MSNEGLGALGLPVVVRNNQEEMFPAFKVEKATGQYGIFGGDQVPRKMLNLQFSDGLDHFVNFVHHPAESEGGSAWVISYGYFLSVVFDPFGGLKKISVLTHLNADSVAGIEINPQDHSQIFLLQPIDGENPGVDASLQDDLSITTYQDWQSGLWQIDNKQRNLVEISCNPGTGSYDVYVNTDVDQENVSVFLPEALKVRDLRNQFVRFWGNTGEMGQDVALSLLSLTRQMFT